MTAPRDSDAVRAKWDQRYRTTHVTASEPAQVVQQHQALLPDSGRALELASGLGGNALFLASRGLEVEAWDISSVAIERLEEMARQQGRVLHTQVRDVVAHPPPANSFDLIVVTRFLERSLCPALSRALRPDGLLLYQTYTLKKTTQTGPHNPHYLLREGELLELFTGLETISYHEGEEAMLVARKR